MTLVSMLRPWVSGAQLFAYVILIVRLISSGLYSTYRWFTIYIGYEALRAGVMSYMSPKTTLYGYVWLFTQPVTWLLYVLVILELYQLVLKNHAGIATFARRALTIALSVSTAISLATLAFEMQDSEFHIIRTYVLVERLILSTLLVLLLLFTAFWAYFPVRVSRNTLVHTRIFAGFFLFKTALLIFRNAIPSDTLNQSINLILQLLGTGCLAAWALLLTQVGEEITSATSYRSNPADEERLVAQLDAINRTLLSSAKK